MASDWFRLHETTDSYGVPRPDLHGIAVANWGGDKSHPNGAPFWVVRVIGTEAALNALEDELSAGEQRLNKTPAKTLNTMSKQDRSASEWDKAFGVE